MVESDTYTEDRQEPTAGREDPGFLTVANLVSLSRIPLGVGFLVSDAQAWLALVVAAGAFTDLLDGLIARTSSTESGVGTLLDPFCDKLFVLMGLVSFLPGGDLDWAAFLILILRDVFTAGTYLLGRLLGRAVPFRSRLGGKLTTAFQVVALFSLIFWPRWVPLVLVFVALASVYAIVDYGTVGIRNWQRGAAA